ncbi:MAG TPA: hypothetical protein VFN67_42595 [Polyangiales bacterium]|nr:hypothetical protein [Polyangiales bacterium]
MPEVEDPKHLQPKAPVAEAVRKLPRARRLLAATIGVATIQFVGGCEGLGGSTVANLMAAPRLPAAGVGQRMDPQHGSAGFQLVANLMVPPRIPQSGVSGQRGGAGVSGNAGASGVAGSNAQGMDAGLEDDAGEA